jgi:hypothetical protein
MKPGTQWADLLAPSDEPDSWVPVVNEISAGSRDRSTALARLRLGFEQAKQRPAR